LPLGDRRSRKPDTDGVEEADGSLRHEIHQRDQEHAENGIGLRLRYLVREIWRELDEKCPDEDTWYPFMWQGSGDIATPDGKHSAFASPATVQALKFWQDTIQQKVAPRNVLGNDGGDVIANLVSGFCAMQNLGIWGVSALRDNAKDFQYGVFPLPLPPNGQQRTICGGWAFVANAKGKNPEEEAKFCVWAVGSMRDDSIQRVVDWCTKANGGVSPRKSALEKGTTEGGYSSAPMKLFKDLVVLTGRS
jgi:multiple sugar transport system substrate-binding protein